MLSVSNTYDKYVIFGYLVLPGILFVKLFFMEGNKSFLIKEFNLMFIDQKSLKKEIGVFLTYMKNKSSDERINLVIEYLNEFYGKPNKDNVEVWLKENFK